MKDPFDALERDLRAAVRARRRRRAGLPALALAGVLALGGGGAVAATQLAGGAAPEREVSPVPREAEPTPTADPKAVDILVRATKDTARSPACRLASRPPAVEDLPLDPRIATLLPALARPVEGVDTRHVLTHLQGWPTGTAVRSTIRTLTLAGGVKLHVFVLAGGRYEMRDPGACIAVRLKRARRLASGALLAAAERLIERAADTRVARSDAQSLWVFTRAPDARSVSGVGLRAEGLRPGIGGSASAPGGGRRYLGIAGPGVAAVRVVPDHAAAKTAHVVQGFYSFALPRGAGRAVAQELDASGATIRSFELRR